VAAEPAATEAGLVDIRAPIVGTFYRSPQPGAAPFVDIGSEVQPDSVIAIVEVMKLMSSIPAMTRGTVREILATDSQFVEKGQLLMRVKPANA
jgi:acetyl-CoA carboxylase biotin carboxyl carrier protein